MANTLRNKTADALKARHWFRFGPGLALAIAVSLVVWRLIPPDRPGPPRIEHTSVPALSTPGLSAPDPEWFAAHETMLGLNTAQANRLHQLEARWKRGTQALQTGLIRASDSFARAMPASGARTETRIVKVQEEAAPVLELTHELLMARSAWWHEADILLTPSQRQLAEQAWAHRFIHHGGQNP